MLDGTGILDDSSFLGSLDPTLAAPFQDGFADALQLVFWIAAGMTVLGLVMLSLLPEVPLRTKSAMEEREDDARAAEALAAKDAAASGPAAPAGTTTPAVPEGVSAAAGADQARTGQA